MKKIIASLGVILTAVGGGIILTNAILRMMREGGFPEDIVNGGITAFGVGIVILLLTWSWLVPPTTKE